MKISLEAIRDSVGAQIYNRGLKYFRDGRVQLIDIEPDYFNAHVAGTQIYLVRVQMKNRHIEASCTCPYWTTCKHVVASLLQAKQYYEEHTSELSEKKRQPQWKPFFENLFAENAKPQNQSIEKNWQIIFNIELSDDFWLLTPQKTYFRKDGTLGNFNSINNINSLSNIQYAPNDPLVINYIQTLKSYAYYYEPYAYQSSNYYRRDYNTKMISYGDNVGAIFNLLIESQVYHFKKGVIEYPFTFEKSPAQVEFVFDRLGEDYILKPYLLWNNEKREMDASYRVMASQPVWILHGNTFFKVENCQNGHFLNLMTHKNTQLKIPSKDLPEFINTYYNKLKAYGTFQLPDSLKFQQINTITKKRIYLFEALKYLLIELKAMYGQHEVDVRNPNDELYMLNSEDDSIAIVKRDFESENKMAQLLLDSGLKTHREGGFQITDSKALRWIFEQIPVLVQNGFEVLGQERLTKYKYNTAYPRVNFSVSSGIDWFDMKVEIDFDGIALSLKELKKAFQKKSPFVQLIDGSLARLPQDWFVKFEHLFNLGKVEEKQVKLSRFHLPLMELMMERADQVQTDEQYQERLMRLKAFDKIEAKPIHDKFTGTLREYQRAGYDWLYFLKDFALGGCLADDMGLGKTAQALALLMNEKMQNNQPKSLIVCPTSVIFNWENEIRKFTPDLRVLNHTGIDRIKDSAAFENYDLILTSYGTLIRDIGFLARYPFHYVILDESQRMKNPVSLTAKSVQLLKSNHRLALTGTPIENSTSELWSLMTFLNPGLLGSSNYFKKAFGTQIEKKKNTDIAEQLRRLIYPFILRRTKEQVAKELPPKVEQISYCHMNDNQKQLYQHWRNYYRAMILRQIDEVGLNKSRMRVLEGLTKLRLISCHPKLVDKDVWENSGKFERLQEFLEEITSENHKVLVFSQFVKMLTIIRSDLDKKNILYEYLDGKTKDREQCINNFQNNQDIKIFLISLRAGGVGVNLTAADYVIHYDPWWNPAVELQATDRTHRIGQNKKVFVYKLITKESIEEKILQLQESKKNLISQLITTDASFFKSITRDDIEVLFS